MAADFHTGTGERLQIAPLPQLKIELDTQSSLRRRAHAQGEGFELVQGQAAIETGAGLRLALFAGPGCVITDEGAVRLDVRNTHGQVRVTCLQGSARIEHPQGRLQLQAGQQTRFDERLSGVVAEAVASEVSAWTEGMLVFRRAPWARWWTRSTVTGGARYCWVNRHWRARRSVAASASMIRTRHWSSCD